MEASLKETSLSGVSVLAQLPRAHQLCKRRYKENEKHQRPRMHQSRIDQARGLFGVSALESTVRLHPACYLPTTARTSRKISKHRTARMVKRLRRTPFQSTPNRIAVLW